MATTRENHAFVGHLLPSCPLDEAIVWITKNMQPEDVFSDKQLTEWAVDSDFIKKVE